MSIHIMNAVWQHGPQVRSPRMLLLAIADNANDRGEAYPSLVLLGLKACMKKSTVLRTLKALEAEGWLEIRHRAAAPEEYGRARGNLYCISLAKLRLQPYGARGVTPTPRQEAAREAPQASSPTAGQDARSVTVTPREAADEVSKTARRGVKNGATRCQNGVALIVEPSEPSEPSLAPPTPAEAGASDPDRDARVAELRRQLKAAKPLSAEYFSLARELAPLIRTSLEPVAARAEAIAPAQASSDPDELAAWLMAQCGFSEEGRRRPVLAPVLRGVIALAEPGSHAARAAAMAKAWRDYTRGPARWGVAKFFIEGHWLHPPSWPDDERGRMRREAGVGGAMGVGA